MEYNLKKEDYEDINSLIMISSQIKDLYDELYKLELDGKKETVEYSKVIEKLKSSLFVETNIYDRIGNSYEKSIQILMYLEQDNSKLKELEEIIPIFSSNLIISRIKSRIIRNAILKSANIIPDEAKLFLSINGVSSKEIMESFSSSINIKESITLDLMNCLLAIIEKETISDKKINNGLKETKYIVSYLYQKVEKSLLENGFEIEKNPYIETILVGQINHWPNEIISKIKNLYGLEYYSQVLKSMLLYDDEDLKDDRIMIKMIINQTFLRTVFLLLDDETIMDLNSSFYDLIDDDKLQNVFENRQKIIEMIINAYRKVKKDKSIPKVISLKL